MTQELTSLFCLLLLQILISKMHVDAESEFALGDQLLMVD